MHYLHSNKCDSFLPLTHSLQFSLSLSEMVSHHSSLSSSISCLQKITFTHSLPFQHGHHSKESWTTFCFIFSSMKEKNGEKEGFFSHQIIISFPSTMFINIAHQHLSLSSDYFSTCFLFLPLLFNSLLENCIKNIKKEEEERSIKVEGVIELKRYSLFIHSSDHNIFITIILVIFIYFLSLSIFFLTPFSPTFF